MVGTGRNPHVAILVVNLGTQITIIVRFLHQNFGFRSGRHPQFETEVVGRGKILSNLSLEFLDFSLQLIIAYIAEVPSQINNSVNFSTDKTTTQSLNRVWHRV